MMREQRMGRGRASGTRTLYLLRLLLLDQVQMHRILVYIHDTTGSTYLVCILHTSTRYNTWYQELPGTTKYSGLQGRRSGDVSMFQFCFIRGIHWRSIDPSLIGMSACTCVCLCLCQFGAHYRSSPGKAGGKQPPFTPHLQMEYTYNLMRRT